MISRKRCRSIAVLIVGASLLPDVAVSQPAVDQATCSTKKVEQRYFRRLAEISSISEPLVGISELSAQEAMDAAHYRMTIDKCNHSREIQYFHGDTPKPIDENFTANRFVPASKITIRRGGNRGRMHFFDNAGAPKTVFDNVQSVDLTFDNDGRLERADFLDASDVPVDNSLGYASVTWSWRGQSNAVETRYDATGEKVLGGGAFPFSEASIDFGNRGFAKTISPVESDHRIHIARDAENVRQSWHVLDENGVPIRGGAAGVARVEYSYDEHGYLAQAKYLDEEGAPLMARSGHMGFQREYNAAGNRLAYHFIDSNGEIWAPPNRGYAGQVFQWRQDGVVRVRTSYVDADGVIVNHPGRGYATISYEFDENNIETKRYLLDDGGAVVGD